MINNNFVAIIIWSIIIAGNLSARPKLKFEEYIKTDICQPSIARELEIDLSNQFCLLKGSFEDSLQEKSTWSDIAAILSEKDSTFISANPQFGPIIAIKDIPEIILFIIPYPNYPYRYVTLAYNTLQGEYYILNGIDDKSLNSLLRIRHRIPKSDRELIEYCRLIAILRNPGSLIKFISSINELIMDAIMRPVPTLDLNRAKNYKNIKIDVPKISRNHDFTEIIFPYAKNSDIVIATVKLRDAEIIQYDEKKIASMIDWFPFFRYIYH